MAASVGPSVRVCFVCLGNICRSPTAEGVMQKLVAREGLADVIAVASAGTQAYHEGELPDARSRAAARARGIELESRARRFTEADWERFDYILAMDGDNYRELARRAPSQAALAKVRLLRSFDPASPADASVPDPYYGGEDGFETVLDLCEAGCRGLLEHLRREHQLG